MASSEQDELGGDGDAMTVPIPKLPDQSMRTYLDMKRSIQKEGVLVPIFVDQNDELLDGAHRLRAIKELGMEEPEKRVITVRDEEHRRSLMAALNLHRRNLTKAQRDKAIADMRSAGMSVREVSDLTGIPKSTVADVKVSEFGHVDAAPVTVGKDGKTYTSTDDVAARRERVAEMYGGLWTRQEMADRLGVTVSVVGADIRHIRKAEGSGQDDDEAVPPADGGHEGLPKKELLKWLQAVADGVSGLAQGVDDEGLDFYPIYHDQKAQEAFERIREHLPTFFSFLERQLSEWKKARDIREAQAS